MASMEKTWFYEIFFSQVVIVIVKDKKRCSIKGKMSIKTSFMHYRNYITWTRVKLPVVFEEFDMVYIFWLLFSFHYYYQLVKGQPLAKNLGGGGLEPPTPPVSTGLLIKALSWFEADLQMLIWWMKLVCHQFLFQKFSFWYPFNFFLINVYNLVSMCLSKIIAWNLPRFTIMWVSLNQFIAIWVSDSRITTN